MELKPFYDQAQVMAAYEIASEAAHTVEEENLNPTPDQLLRGLTEHFRPVLHGQTIAELTEVARGDRGQLVALSIGGNRNPLEGVRRPGDVLITVSLEADRRTPNQVALDIDADKFLITATIGEPTFWDEKLWRLLHALHERGKIAGEYTNFFLAHLEQRWNFLPVAREFVAAYEESTRSSPLWQPAASLLERPPEEFREYFCWLANEGLKYIDSAGGIGLAEFPQEVLKPVTIWQKEQGKDLNAELVGQQLLIQRTAFRTVEVESDQGYDEVPPQTLEEYMQDAKRALRRMRLDPRFKELCQERQISAEGEGAPTPAYWEALAIYARILAREARAAKVDGRQIAMRLLVASTPNHIFQQRLLGQKGVPTPIFRTAKRRACRYGKFIRDVAEAFPDLSATKLTADLVEVAEVANEPRRYTRRLIRNVVRGVQHELAFAQLLGHIGKPPVLSGVVEDLRGYDLTIDSGDPVIGNIYIDVKGSPGGLKFKYKTAKSFFIQPDGIVSMASLVSPADIDGFVVPEPLLKRLGAKLKRRLTWVNKELRQRAQPPTA